MPHVALLGDSVFDNGAYVRGGPDVAAQLRRALGADWRVTLVAVDGAIIEDVARQLASLPTDVTHLVVSAGGNDALMHAELLDRAAASSAEVLDAIADAVDAFHQRFREMLLLVLERELPTVICTIYGGNLGGRLGRRAGVILAAFNDRILREAVRTRTPAIELRLVCTTPADYANPIEPSEIGGEKIARAVRGALLGEGKGTVVTGL